MQLETEFWPLFSQRQWWGRTSPPSPPRRQGETVIRDAAELKVKESNRIDAMVRNLAAMGADVTETEDGMIIRGGKTPHGASFETYKDHRIAMSLAVLALAADGASRIDDPEVVAISYPGFFHTLEQLGG